MLFYKIKHILRNKVKNNFINIDISSNLLTKKMTLLLIFKVYFAKNRITNDIY